MERHKNVAKWGAACAPCAAAKAKCLRSSEAPGSKCDRCQRLFKECSSQVHRPRKKRVSKPSKTAQLEERLNGLVDMLRASGELPTLHRPETLTYDAAASVEVACACLPSESDPNVSVHNGPSPSTQADSSSADPNIIPVSYNSYAPPSCVCRPGGIPIMESPESDEILFARFQTHMSPHFPFVIVPPGVTVAELEATKPFLFSCIRAVASIPNSQVMQGQMYRIIQHLSDYMIMRSERSLDLLQGIVVVLGWYHHHCMMHAQMNNLIHLAMSLIADLGLNQHPSLAERTRLMVLNPDEPAPRTNEEKRILLAVWYLSSCVSVGFQKIESMKFSAYAQRCLKELEDEKEYDSDIYITYLIRLQHLTEKIFLMNTADDPINETPGIPRAPLVAYRSAFQSELDRIQSSLTKNLRNNKFLINHITSASLHLYEPPVIDTALVQKISAALTSVTPSQPSVLDLFYRSNAALRSWFEHWFTIPIHLYHWLPLPVCCQLIFGVTMLSRWARLVGPGRSVHPVPPVQHVDDPSARSPATASLNKMNIKTLQDLSLGKGPLPLVPDDLCTEEEQQQLPTPSSRAPTTSASPLAKLNINQSVDPAIPAAVAALREQLRSQPELNLDILAILAAIGVRFEQADRELREMGSTEDDDDESDADEPGDVDTCHAFDRRKRVGNIWDLSAKKVMIARAKLERWAEIVATGGAEAAILGLPKDEVEELGKEQRRQRQQQRQGEEERQKQLSEAPSNASVEASTEAASDEAQGSSAGDEASQHTGSAGGGGVDGMEGILMGSGDNMNCVPGSTEGWDFNALWRDDLFDGIDPNLWFDGAGLAGEWAGIPMNGFVGQHQ